MEKIISINEIDSDKMGGDSRWDCWDGFKVQTSERIIYFVVEGTSSCCESWGYLSSSDSFEEFIGADLLSVNEVDTAYNKKMVDLEQEDRDCGDIAFCNLETSNGTLQFAVYDSHNGYYGHEMKLHIEKIGE